MWATGNPSFAGRERAGERRVDVAGDDHDVGLDARAARASTPTSDRAVCSAWLPEPTSEEDVRLRQPELVEEDVRHLVVVVLAGVDEQRARRRGGLPQRAIAPARPS